MTDIMNTIIMIAEKHSPSGTVASRAQSRVNNIHNTRGTHFASYILVGVDRQLRKLQL